MQNALAGILVSPKFNMENVRFQFKLGWTKGAVTLATNSGDIARRLVAGDKFIAAMSLSDFFLSPLQVTEPPVYRRYKSLSD